MLIYTFTNSKFEVSNIEKTQQKNINEIKTKIGKSEQFSARKKIQKITQKKKTNFIGKFRRNGRRPSRRRRRISTPAKTR